jgi:integrase
MAWIDQRKTKSGEVRYDVGYRGPDGRARRKTFRRAKDAQAFKRRIETELHEGDWIDPNAGKLSLRDYTVLWMSARPDLSPKTRDGYASLLRLHIVPALGDLPLNRISPAVVRSWRSDLFKKGERAAGGRRFGPITVAKSYRLLHTIFETAVSDELVRRNPCKIEGAGKEEYEERTIATVPQVFALADEVKPERRLLILLAAFAGLRLGELLALRRRHVDVVHSRIHIREAETQLDDGTRLIKAPKSRAGFRTIHLDDLTFQSVREHLDLHTGVDADAFLFTGRKGHQLARCVWQREWTAARRSVGMTTIHFHDLRHTHGTMITARLGATTKEAMSRLGHSSMRAALIYQHADSGRDQEIAKLLGDHIKTVMGPAADVLPSQP